MRNLLSALLLFLLGLSLSAQTRLPIDMFKGGTPAAEGQVLVFTSSGQFRLVSIGSGLFLNCPVSGPCLLEVSVVQRPRQIALVSVSAVLDSHTLPSAPLDLDVIRNGLELSLGVDYTLSGAVISFLPGAKPQPGDLLRVKYSSR